MFDIGLSELVLVGVVALVVLGPERLPKAARTAGLFIGRARAMVTRYGSELERELRAEELRQSLREEARRLETTARELHGAAQSALSVDVGGGPAAPSAPTPTAPPAPSSAPADFAEPATLTSHPDADGR